MRVWNDHVEVWNDGELPIGFTPDTLMEQHSSHPRQQEYRQCIFQGRLHRCLGAWLQEDT